MLMAAFLPCASILTAYSKKNNSTAIALRQKSVNIDHGRAARETGRWDSRCGKAAVFRQSTNKKSWRATQCVVGQTTEMVTRQLA
tara:strand:+ start:3819 stop:4073 length:255 start_codon:yes stop_codon:yes gene_type:complete